MNEFERGISVLLDAAVPEPRTAIDLDDVRAILGTPRTSMRRRMRWVARRRTGDGTAPSTGRRRLAVAGAVVVSLAIAVGAYVLARPASSPTAVHLTAGTTDPAGHPSGVITGRFLAVGGPSAVGSPRPVKGVGTVRMRNVDDGRVLTVDTRASGQYRSSVPPGTYTLEGTTPSYQDGHATCTGTRPVTVGKNRTTTANVICQER